MKFFLKYSAVFPALISGFAILCWLLIVLPFFDIHDFIYIGSHFVQKSYSSPVINNLSKYAQKGYGYDGQFFYYLALDPIHAFSYIDDPPYRMARVFYPLMTRVFSFGKQNLIAYNLLIINIASIIGTVYLLSKYLQRFNLSPYYSLIYGFYPGVWVSMAHDLNESLAYFLTMAGVFFFDSKKISKLAISVLMFSLAIFTRELTAVFSLVFMGSLIFKTSADKQIQINQYWKRGLFATLIILVPFLLYFIFLNIYYTPDLSAHLSFPPILPYLWPWTNPMTLVMLPALITGIIPMVLIKNNRLTPAVAILGIHLLLLLSLIPDDFVMYANIGRYANGLVLAAVLCLPDLINYQRKLVTIIVGAAMLWFQAWIFQPDFIGGSQIGIYIYYASMILFVYYFYKLKLTNEL